MQSNKQSDGPSQPITLYNAGDRYQMIVSEINEIEKSVDALKENAHPGVFDIFIHLSMLKTAASGASEIFGSAKPKMFSPKSIRMLTNLEKLVVELREIVKDARAELLPEKS